MTLSGKGANDFFKMSGPDSLLRAGGESQISGKSFLLTAALQIGAGGAYQNGPINNITTFEVRNC